MRTCRVRYSWGWGESGSTGHNNREHQHTPKVISALIGTRVVQASAGSGHSLFVDEEARERPPVLSPRRPA